MKSATDLEIIEAYKKSVREFMNGRSFVYLTKRNIDINRNMKNPYSDNKGFNKRLEKLVTAGVFRKTQINIGKANCFSYKLINDTAFIHEVTEYNKKIFGKAKVRSEEKQLIEKIIPKHRLTVKSPQVYQKLLVKSTNAVLEVINYLSEYSEFFNFWNNLDENQTAVKDKISEIIMVEINK